MTERHLSISLQSDWKGALRAAAQVAKAGIYQGEVLNFETPAQLLTIGMIRKLQAGLGIAAQSLIQEAAHT